MCIYVNTAEICGAKEDITAYAVRYKNDKGEIVSPIYQSYKWTIGELVHSADTLVNYDRLIREVDEDSIIELPPENLISPARAIELGKYVYDGEGFFHFYKNYEDAKRVFDFVCEQLKTDVFFVGIRVVLICEHVIPKGTNYIEGKIHMTASDRKESYAAVATILTKTLDEFANPNQYQDLSKDDNIEEYELEDE
jgi:hypothetical protein